MILSIAGMMADVDVDVAISKAGKQEWTLHYQYIFLTWEWSKKVISEIFPRSIVGIMADAEVDVTISIAGKQEYRHCTTSTYSLLRSSPKRSAWRCSEGPFGSSIILNGSCYLVLVAASTTMVSFLSMPGNQLCSLANCFVFTNP